MRAKWQKIETGWYTLDHVAGICREQDGRWHVYIEKERPHGDANFATLRAAQQYVAGMLATRAEAA